MDDTPTPAVVPHFITDKKGKRLAVVLPLAQYKRLVQVHKRLARLERLAGAYHDIDAALGELRDILADTEAATPLDELFERLPAERP